MKGRTFRLLTAMMIVSMVLTLLPFAVAASQPAQPSAQAQDPVNKRGMRLEIGSVAVKDMKFGDKTELKDGVLTINKDELTAYLLQDKRLGKIELDIANPGDKTRIVRVINEYQPRARTGDRKGQFPYPGVLGAGTNAGEGGLIVLKDAAVVVSDPSNLDNQPRLQPRAPDNAGAVIQMTGPEGGFFAGTHNLVVVTYPPKTYDYAAKVMEGVITTQEREDYQAALAVVGLRASAFLGDLAVDLKPESTEVYALPPVGLSCQGDLAKLPRIAYVLNFGQSNASWNPAFGTNTTVPIIYGEDANFSLPTVVHPNEILDGAAMYPVSYSVYGWTNNKYIMELFARHGKDLCFVGVVLTQNRGDPTMDMRYNAMAARLVAVNLAADGVIITKNGGGAPQDQIARIAKLAMGLGVKGAVVDPLATTQVIFTNPDPKIGVVQIGTDVAVKMPAVEKVIGFSSQVTKTMVGAMSVSGVNPFREVGGSYQMTIPEYTPADDPVKGPAPAKEVTVEKPSSTRAIDMALAMIAGKPYEPEIVTSTYTPVKAAPGIKDPSKAKIAILSGTGLVRRDDERRFAPSRALDGRFSAYDITNVQTLPPTLWEVNHGGYKENWAREDPHRLIPLPTWREFEREGKIGKVNDTMYCYSSLANFWLGMNKVAEGIIPRLKAEGVEAVIATAT